MGRKALAVLVVLFLATSGALLLRLDPNKLSISAQSQLQQWSGQNIEIGPASLNLLHGVSIRIRDVALAGKKETWHLHADSMIMGLSLWRLLQGKADINTVEMIHPVLDLSKPSQMKNIILMDLPKPLDRIRIRQGYIRINGKPVAQGFDGTLRRFSRKQELTWELQTSLIGGELVTQGRITPAVRGYTVFGKLKARHVYIKDLSDFFPDAALPKSAYDTFETSLTFDVNASRKWNLFGDAGLHTSARNAPDIILRGKVGGSGWQQMNWHDAFLQIGRNAMLSTAGECVRGKGCNFDIDARDAKISLLLKALGLNHPLKGRLDAKLLFSWENGRWSAKGKLLPHHVAWSDISVPDAAISIPNVLYHAPEHVEFSGIHFQTVDTDGGMTLNGLIKSSGEWSLDAHVKDMTRAWVPFTNILLKSHGMKPEIRGQGALSAHVKIFREAGRTGIDFSIHADQAQLGYAGMFEKPEGVPASMTAHADIAENRIRLAIRHAELGGSRAGLAQWVFDQGNINSVSAENIQVDLSGLKQKGIVFPTAMQNWHGAIRGRFSHVRPHAGAATADWFEHSDAQLELAEFGAGREHWNGAIHILNGDLSTPNLQWRNAAEHARLSGSIHLPSLRGNMNIQDAALSWEQGDALPAWIAHAKVRGHLRNIDLDWMGNTWGEVHGVYRISDHHITLGNLRGHLAGGGIQSPKLSLILSPESIHFSGPVRMAMIRLNKLQGLSETLGANLDGSMYLNANLEGELPWHTKSAWQGNGDIEIRHGHWQPVDKKLTIVAGDLHTETGKRVSFSHFATRFHVDRSVLRLTRMQLETGTKQIIGNAFLHPDGEIGGHLQIRGERGTQKVELIGNWPGATGLFRSK